MSDFKSGDRVVLTGVVIEADRYGGALVQITTTERAWVPNEHLRHAEPVHPLLYRDADVDSALRRLAEPGERAALVFDLLRERWRSPFRYHCTRGHWVISNDPDLDCDDDDTGPCPVPGCDGRIADALVPAWMLSLIEGRTEPVERAAPWPPPSGPAEVWQDLWRVPFRRAGRPPFERASSEAEALRAWHEARR